MEKLQSTPTKEDLGISEGFFSKFFEEHPYLFYMGSPPGKFSSQINLSKSPKIDVFIGNHIMFLLTALAFKNSLTGSPSQGSTASEPEPIGVFWDIENCPVPRGKSASAVVQKIRKEFFSGKREAEFMCVCDINKEKKEVIEELNKAQVRF